MHSKAHIGHSLRGGGGAAKTCFLCTTARIDKLSIRALWAPAVWEGAMPYGARGLLFCQVRLGNGTYACHDCVVFAVIRRSV
jgi:hypothetical protein